MEYNNLCRINKATTIRDFVSHLKYKSKGDESYFFKKLYEDKDEIKTYSLIYPIQNWLKIFNLKMFNKLSKQDSEDQKITQFVKTNNL